MKALRKLILGETWTLPAAVAVALLAAGALRAATGPHGWWHDAGGFVLLALVLAGLALSLRPARR
ncbi:MAG: hypothetical protein ACJ77M_01210 [Thermoleophilaceae bacterium]|jgi:hypothetical protein